MSYRAEKKLSFRKKCLLRPGPLPIPLGPGKFPDGWSSCGSIAALRKHNDTTYFVILCKHDKGVMHTPKKTYEIFTIYIHV